MAHRIRMAVKPGGGITTTVRDIHGPSCAERTRFLDSLGKIIRHDDTPEAHEHVNESEVDVEKVNTGSDW
jgi:hypothetical protein